MKREELMGFVTKAGELIEKVNGEKDTQKLTELTSEMMNVIMILEDELTDYALAAAKGKAKSPDGITVEKYDGGYGTVYSFLEGDTLVATIDENLDFVFEALDASIFRRFVEAAT